MEQQGFLREHLAAKQQLVLCCLKSAGREVMVRVMSCVMGDLRF